MVSLVATKGEFASLEAWQLEPFNIRLVATGDRCATPRLCLQERSVQILIRLHDRAPIVASQIQIDCDVRRCGVVAAGGVDVLKPVIVKVKKLAAPRPTGFGNL